MKKSKKEKKGAHIEARGTNQSIAIYRVPLFISIKDYEIDLVRKETIEDRVAYLLNVKPKD